MFLIYPAFLNNTEISVFLCHNLLTVASLVQTGLYTARLRRLLTGCLCSNVRLFWRVFWFPIWNAKRRYILSYDFNFVFVCIHFALTLILQSQICPMLVNMSQKDPAIVFWFWNFVQKGNIFQWTISLEYFVCLSDQISIPDFDAGAMENWGLITYREARMIWDPAHSTTYEKQRMTGTLAHELLHQVFCNTI